MKNCCNLVSGQPALCWIFGVFVFHVTLLWYGDHMFVVERLWHAARRNLMNHSKRFVGQINTCMCVQELWLLFRTILIIISDEAAIYYRYWLLCNKCAVLKVFYSDICIAVVRMQRGQYKSNGWLYNIQIVNSTIRHNSFKFSLLPVLCGHCAIQDRTYTVKVVN